ncbi:roadblock/LC7 domain-containing protein, partial [Streptomyces sp. NPDC003860]
MSPDLSWMLEDIVRNVPKARHAVLLSADGLPRGATEGLPAKDVRTISAAMAGMQSLSRAIAHFAGALVRVGRGLPEHLAGVQVEGRAAVEAA